MRQRRWLGRGGATARHALRARRHRCRHRVRWDWCSRTLRPPSASWAPQRRMYSRQSQACDGLWRGGAEPSGAVPSELALARRAPNLAVRRGRLDRRSQLVLIVVIQRNDDAAFLHDVLPLARLVAHTHTPLKRTSSKDGFQTRIRTRAVGGCVAKQVERPPQ